LLLKLLDRDVKEGGEFLDIFRGSLRLTVEDGRCGNLIPTNVLSDVLEAEFLARFGVKERLRGSWQIRVLGYLHWNSQLDRLSRMLNSNSETHVKACERRHRD